MNDSFEDRLAALLNESVDAQLATRTAAPPFTPPSDAASRTTGDVAGDELAVRRRRFQILAVAATVVAVLASAVALAVAAPGDGHHKPPAQHATPPRPAPITAVSGTAPAPTTTPSTTPGTPSSVSRSGSHPTDTPTTTGTTRSRPATATVRVGGADLVLPHGWVARPYTEYVGSIVPTTWCLTPRSTPASKASVFSCPIVFTEFDPATAESTMDPDAMNGLAGEEPQALYSCISHVSGTLTETASLATFGGREAEARRFTLTCPGAPSQSRVEAQYSVVTRIGYILTAYRTSPSIDGALDDLLTESRLPSATGPLRLADLGRVTSVHRTSRRLVVTIRRTYNLPGKSGADSYVDEGNTTARYVVPRSVATTDGTAGIVKGDVVSIATNGRRVTNFNSL